MEVASPFYAYKETRLDLDSTIQCSTIAVRLPTHSSTSYSSRASQKRPHIAEPSSAQDESTFREKYLATAASIYYRTSHKTPRSFLWRILEDGKVLSIRAVDVSKQASLPDASLTLHLRFPESVMSGCVALSDSKEHDVLSVFALTESKLLYTLSLRPDYFRRAASTEDNVADWCKIYSSSVFSFKQPHRLVALSANELFVALQDGSLMKLERNSGGDGSAWKEIHYNEGSWGHGLRSLIPFQGGNTIRYGKHNLALSTATSIVSPVTLLGDLPYAFTVSLDHRLRIWNLNTGKISFVTDILNQNSEAPEEARKVIDPSQLQLVKVVGDNDESALCVTYSPLGNGQFKFWNATPSMDGSLELADLFPDNVLEPQAPTSEIWTLADFAVVLDKANVNKYTLWALWKNNVTYRLHKLDFKSGSTAHVREAWADGWMAMATETLRETSLPVLTSGASDATDKWLELILAPGRFSRPTIETGLAIYGQGLGAAKEMSKSTESLLDRMCGIIASTSSLGRKSNGSMDYAQFRAATDVQWRRFYRLLLELDKQRGEAMSLAIDPLGEMPWVVLADGITAVRDCSALERIWHNNNSVPEGTEAVARPLFAAAQFRDSISDQFVQNCREMLLEEVFQESSLTGPARLRTFYDKCDFANQIGDEDYSQLQTSLGGGFKDVTPEVYEAMLELMVTSEEPSQRKQALSLAEFGNKLVVKGAQETVELHRNVCLDQLILLVLIEGEINHGEDGIQFEAALVFGQLVDILKRLELMNWLTSTQISLPLKRSERSSSVIEKTSTLSKAAPSLETITVLEGVLRHLFSLDLQKGETMPTVVTEVIVRICAPDSEYEAPSAVIQCFLLKHDRPDLALDFSRFTGQDPFSIYIQGRVSLAANDPQTASSHFKKAAFGMAYLNPKKRSDLRTAGFLDETERPLLHAGLSEYYSHIVALYDKTKVYSYVIEFARLSLQFFKSNDIQASQLRTEMHSRLFNAAIQTSRYELAHSILNLFTDSALQQSSLTTLVTRMSESSYASELISLPFLGLQDRVDEVLLSRCQTIVDVGAGIPYHKILYAWRIKRGDFRGAAAISLDRLQRLIQAGYEDQWTGDGALETPVTKQYAALINALSCVDAKQAWILAEEPQVFEKKGNKPSLGAAKEKPKRKVITLADVRKEYQTELDRIAAIQNNQFTAFGGDEMDVL